MDRITQGVEQADLTIQEQANKLYDVVCDLEEIKCLKKAFCDFGNHIGDISSINLNNEKKDAIILNERVVRYLGKAMSTTLVAHGHFFGKLASFNYGDSIGDAGFLWSPSAVQ